MLLWFDVAWKTGKSYWQAEYLQHLPALALAMVISDMVGVLPQNSGHSPIPNNVEMIQSRWICFVTVSMVTKCCGVSFRQLDDVRQEMRKQFWWKPRHEMETNWKTLEYSDILIIIFVPHFPICLCWCDQTSI